ncbi:MAG: YybS family protein [Pseudomonadota bacterium]|nr:YybS family protein [Pseudomonadota bacterium]
MTTPFASRGALTFAGAVLAGCLSATILTVALNHAESVIFFLAYLTAIPLFLAGFSAGPLAGCLATLSGLAGLLLTAPSNYAVIYSLLFGFPAALLIVLALRHRMGADGKSYWYPEGNLLTATSLYPCALFLILNFMAVGHDGGLLGLTREFVNDAATALKARIPAEAAGDFAATMDFIIRFLPAITGAAWMVTMLLSVIVGQTVLQRQNWHLRSGFTMHELQLPDWLIYAVAVTGLVGVVAPPPYNYIGLNMSLVLGFPFLILGLAIVHSWAETKKATTLILVVFYLAMTLFRSILVMTALLGLIDHWVHFRQRFANQPKST